MSSLFLSSATKTNRTFSLKQKKLLEAMRMPTIKINDYFMLNQLYFKDHLRVIIAFLVLLVISELRLAKF